MPPPQGGGVGKKKPIGTQHHNRKASTRATLRALEPEEVDIPDLPPHPYNGDWQPETVDWWEDVWASPMASEFVAADVHGMFRLAMMVNDFWIEPTASRHAEIRIAQAAYGLTPYDRRKLEWTVETAEAAKDRGNQRRRSMSAEQHSAADDPRLRIVGDMA